jgi:hypothetical protein
MVSRERQDAVVIAHWEKKIQLVIDYAAAVAAYHSAVAELERGMVSGSRELFMEQLRWVEEARIASEAARTALAEHIAADGC